MYPEGATGAARGRDHRRDHRGRQRQHRWLARHRPELRRRVVPVERAATAARSWRHRGRARTVRHHGRRRRQLRLPRDRRGSSRSCAGLRAGAGLPPALGGRDDRSRAPCRSSTAGWATRVLSMARAAGSTRRSTTCIAACAASPRCSTGRLDLRCTGMEFATEMIIKASLSGQRIAEVPITLQPDGRKSHAPHLRTFRDGWRTLRLLPALQPALAVPAARRRADPARSGRLRARACPGVALGGVTFDAHTLLFASLAHSLRVPGRSSSHLHQDLRDQRRAAPDGLDA